MGAGILGDNVSGFLDIWAVVRTTILGGQGAWARETESGAGQGLCDLCDAYESFS